MGWQHLKTNNNDDSLLDLKTPISIQNLRTIFLPIIQVFLQKKNLFKLQKGVGGRTEKDDNFKWTLSHPSSYQKTISYQKLTILFEVKHASFLMSQTKYVELSVSWFDADNDVRVPLCLCGYLKAKKLSINL